MFLGKEERRHKIMNRNKAGGNTKTPSRNNGRKKNQLE